MTGPAVCRCGRGRTVKLPPAPGFNFGMLGLCGDCLAEIEAQWWIEKTLAQIPLPPGHRGWRAQQDEFFRPMTSPYTLEALDQMRRPLPLGEYRIKIVPDTRDAEIGLAGLNDFLNTKPRRPPDGIALPGDKPRRDRINDYALAAVTIVILLAVGIAIGIILTAGT